MLSKKSAFLFLLLALPLLSASAQTTGKIAGRIVDGSTGEGLPGANVIVVGTTLGVATDAEGNYFIIGVPVGNYDVQASFVGYASETVQAVEVNAGYTRELNFELLPGVELDEIVVAYERPLIQKDAVGAPKIVTAEEIQNLPVRGPAEVAKIQAGVVAKEGSGTLNIRGGRGAEVTYYIDGVKVNGTTGLPQSAIQQQEMLIGNINARYGDVMSGVINITTKAGSNEFFGSVEAITSEELDSYGYNLLSGTVGGPIIKNKLTFFAAAEYLDQLDANPRATGQLYVPDDILNDLRNAPIAFTGQNMDGSDITIPLPASLTNGAFLMVDDTGAPIVSDGGSLTFNDGTTVNAQNLDPSTLNLRPVLRAENLDPSDFQQRNAKRKNAYQNISGTANLTWNVLENSRLRVGGRINVGEWDNTPNTRQIVFAPEMARVTERTDYQIYGSWTQYLSNSSFFQIQADYSNRETESYDPRFGPGLDHLLEYGNIDNPVFATLAGYKDLSFTTDTRTDADGNSFDVLVPTYNRTYRDGSGPATSDEVVSTLVQVPGGRFNTYSKGRNQQFRVTGSATAQIGLHQIEFGGEFEQRTQRAWSISAANLSRYVNDGNPEQIAPNDPDLNAQGYSSYDAIPAHVLDNLVSYYGYDLRGRNEIDSEDFGAFLNQSTSKPEADYNLKPYEPRYYGGYIQDKIEFNDLILNLGFRVDVFDNNSRVLVDRFARRPICRAGDLGGSANGVDCGSFGSLPNTINDDYSVFYSGDDVVGFRDLDGNFYTSDGEEANPGDILLTGKPRNTNGQVTEDMFTDYDPEVLFMPRIGVSFPVTDRALFYAHYGIVSQRPSSRTIATLNAFTGTGGVNNPNLRPEKTTKYELGYRQRLTDRSALTISGFFHQIENLIQLRDLRVATPSAYSSYENVDFGTVKGLEFDYDLRRQNGFAARLNYTLSFADGTGSGDRTTSTIVWIDETPPNFISPLDFDQRHKLNLSVDYRLGRGEGPELFGVRVLENFGVNVLATAGSGFPYTPVVEPFNLAGAARAAQPSGGVNSGRMPWNNRVDIRVDRAFDVGGAQLSAFIWVQNLFDNVNTNNVWRFTGLPGTDGFLATAEGARFLGDKPAVAESLYNHRNNVLSWVGIPRMTRIGVRLDF